MIRPPAGHTAVLLLGIVIGLSLGVAAAVRAGKPAPGAADDLPVADARLLAEVLERVKRDYVDPVNDHQLLTAAVHGMVSSLDPHSEYLEGEDYEDIKISSSGEYSGVGLEVSLQDGSVVVITPIDGGSAAAAGIHPGDVVISIDGVPVETGSLDAVIRRMRGPEGSEVRIGIERENLAEPLEFRLKRARIELRSVKWQMAEPGVGYARISQFSDNTGEDLAKDVAAMIARNGGRPLKGLLLDLRNNPGGVLEAAVAVSDEFLDKGIIVTARGRTEESRFEMDATPGDDLKGAPIVVLVNAGSASAAEIVAAALHDNHRATLVGRRTFGKGSVQTIIPLSDSRALKLTTSRYFTPSGASINHKGIEPDVLIERDAGPAPGTDGEDDAAIGKDAEVRRALQELHRLGTQAAHGPQLTARLH
ncbi:MAG: S41 family peptidase [Steroidobacteraceae bacterium]